MFHSVSHIIQTAKDGFFAFLLFPVFRKSYAFSARSTQKTGVTNLELIGSIKVLGLQLGSSFNDVTILYDHLRVTP